VILITGPTGSGKTTTLYGAVNYLNNDETSIVTAEDPVEYVVDGIAQCSINPQLNITFEETLRHIVRQDPDVIVLGEIRDNFSAEAAIQAALTGHKVLTTFHTEDTIGGLLRLMNMDIETFLISSTVVSVLAQRLLRRVCSPTSPRLRNCARWDTAQQTPPPAGSCTAKDASIAVTAATRDASAYSNYWFSTRTSKRPYARRKARHKSAGSAWKPRSW
jgi:type II secretory ATPase GspE/PulE/Tfp pilus assembly ATPase PilB-like protein